jgi:hypothetical protein
MQLDRSVVYNTKQLVRAYVLDHIESGSWHISNDDVWFAAWRVIGVNTHEVVRAAIMEAEQDSEFKRLFKKHVACAHEKLIS